MAWLNPLWMVAVGVAIALILLSGFYALVRLIGPRVAAVASTTAKEALSEPLFYVALVIGIFALILFPFLPYFTFGEDVKVVKDMGLQLIMVLSIGLAVWTASVSIAEEIEGRTALTLLSKPVARWQFIMGKFLGILGPVAILFIVLGAFFLGSVSYKVVHEARESSLPAPTGQECRAEMINIVPGLVLAFMETVVLTSITVAIATRLPMLPNLIICASIYLLGHLRPTLVNVASRLPEIPFFVAHLLAAVLPALDTFNIYTAIATGSRLTLSAWLSYLGLALFYCVLYSSIAMFVALLLFEDRDLA